MLYREDVVSGHGENVIKRVATVPPFFFGSSVGFRVMADAQTVAGGSGI